MVKKAEKARKRAKSKKVSHEAALPVQTQPEPSQAALLKPDDLSEAQQDLIANRVFWRLTRNADDVDLRHRLKAAEDLSRSWGQFTDNVKNNHSFTKAPVFNVIIRKHE